MPQNNSKSSSFLQRLSTSTRSSFMSAKDVRCNVHLLHDSDIIGNEFPRTQSAQTVLDYVCDLKNIQEKDFLGLRYQDHHKHRYWLDLTRSIGHVVKQFKTDTIALHLRFRYYPSDPTRLSDPNLRYQLFVQLQRDLLHGRLYSPASSSAELAALILQAQLGDYNESIHVGNYVSEYKLLLKQTPKLEEKIAEIHKKLKGKSSVDAELEFLEKASQLDTYAFDPYTLKDQLDPMNPVYLGASCKGILIYANQQRTHHIEWNELVKCDYSGRELRLTLADTYKGGNGGTPTGTLSVNGGGSPVSGAPNGHVDKNGQKKPVTLKYQCPSGAFAKHLWIHILSQQAFFNETSAQEVKLKFSKPRIPLLSRGSTFRFPSKRVYREIEEDDIRTGPLQFDRSVLMDNSMIHNNDTTVTSNEDDSEDKENHLDVSTVSAPAVSISSSVHTMASNVQRYELPRQTPRAEQPWLVKTKQANGGVVGHGDDATSSSATTPDGENHNNNYSKSVNLNFSLLDNAGGPSSSSTSTPSPLSSQQEPPKIVRTFEHADQNSTSFTVHLIKREEIGGTSSEVTSSGDGEGRHQNLRAQALEHKFNELVEQDVDFGRPLASSTPRSIKTMFEKNGNGHLANGNGGLEKKSNGHTIRTEEKQDSIVNEDSSSEVSSSSTSSSRRGWITNTFFGSLLVLLLVLAVVICLFEKSEGSAHNDWIENNRHLSNLRHFYYEPSRHFIVDRYRKYFGAKI